MARSFEGRGREDQSQEAFRAADRGTLEKNATERLEGLAPLLEAESKNLRKLGFPVDERCRLDPEQYGDVFSPQDLGRDKAVVVNNEKRHLEDGGSGAAVGELIETVKTVAFNRAWFGGRLVAVRTAKFDDYQHGVDEIIFDTKTNQALAATDTTANPNLKSKRLLESVQNGMKVRYGASISASGVRKEPREGLPYFIIPISPDDLLRLADELIASEGQNLSSEAKAKLLDVLFAQSERFAPLAGPAVRKGYESARRLFEGLTADEDARS